MNNKSKSSKCASTVNRKQSRDLSKLRFSKDEIKNLLQVQAKNATEYTVKVYSVALAATLYDKFDFKEEDLRSVIVQTEDLFDNILEDRVSFEDWSKVLAEEVNIHINI